MSTVPTIVESGTSCRPVVRQHGYARYVKPTTTPKKV